MLKTSKKNETMNEHIRNHLQQRVRYRLSNERKITKSPTLQKWLLWFDTKRNMNFIIDEICTLKINKILQAI